jgi:hypothetical protein
VACNSRRDFTANLGKKNDRTGMETGALTMVNRLLFVLFGCKIVQIN